MLSFYAPSRFVISETSSIEEEQELTIHTRDAHIFKLYKVTTRGGLERGETYVLLVFLFFLDRFSSLARSNLVPQLTDSHQRYALALKGKLRYCYSSLSCGLCLLQQLLRSKNQHRSHGKSDRRIRDAINSPSFCNFNLTLPYEKFAPQNPREPRILNPGRMSRLFINILCINVYITEEEC